MGLQHSEAFLADFRVLGLGASLVAVLGFGRFRV